MIYTFRKQPDGSMKWIDSDGQPLPPSGSTDWLESRRTAPTHIGTKNPLKSMAAACHSSQAETFTKDYIAAGITGAYHEPDGTAVFESQKARNAVLKLRGMVDRDAGYGDYSGD